MINLLINTMLVSPHPHFMNYNIVETAKEELMMPMSHYIGIAIITSALFKWLY